MCDTLGTLCGGVALFAKNSDRSPNEPQVLEFYPEASHEEKTLRATYIEVEQVRHTHALFLSRPNWIWGGEIGVNDCGVAIGNEAVFTRGRYGDAALLGMDLLRLALERSESAKQALDTILSLLDRYGQGGNCGFDHSFFYDNAYLIMDRNELYVLETCGKEWTYQKARSQSISNRLCIGSGGVPSGRRLNFTLAHQEPLHTYFSGSKYRRAQTQAALLQEVSVPSLMQALRSHHPATEHPMAKASVRSVCMHAGDGVSSHTTSSLIVELCAPRPLLWATGTSTPCVSLFKPYLFANEPIQPVFHGQDPAAKQYWLHAEHLRRRLLGKQLPAEFYQKQQELESQWFSASRAILGDPKALFELSQVASRQEQAFYAQWDGAILPSLPVSRRFQSYWQTKTQALEQPAHP